MRTPGEIQVRSASMYRWLMDHFGGAEHLPEKLILHFEVDVPDLIAENERLRATLYPESVVLHNAAVHHALRREVNRVAAHAATEDRTLTWVADELIHAMATNPYPDGSPADEIERLRAELAATYVQAIDFDGESVWQDPDTGMVVWTPPGYDGKATRVLEPLYRRVTEPAGSVTA